MLTFEFPLLVRVTLLVLELPALTLPKLKLVGFAETLTVEATPVPLKEMVAGELGAVLETTTAPVRLPAVAGANTALKLVLAPAARVAGVFKPLTLYPAPLTVSCEMVRDVFPLFVRVKACDLVCPSTTLPKLKLEGVMFNPLWTPVPPTGIISGDPPALLLTVILPFTA